MYAPPPSPPSFPLSDCTNYFTAQGPATPAQVGHPALHTNCADTPMKMRLNLISTQSNQSIGCHGSSCAGWCFDGSIRLCWVRNACVHVGICMCLRVYMWVCVFACVFFIDTLLHSNMHFIPLAGAAKPESKLGPFAVKSNALHLLCVVQSFLRSLSLLIK